MQRDKGDPVTGSQGSEWTSLQNVASHLTNALGLKILTALKHTGTELIA